MKNKTVKAPQRIATRPPAQPRAMATHGEIALQAEWLWRQEGCPIGRDEPIWLEAERQLDKIPRSIRTKWDRFCQSNPLSRMEMHSGAVMAELDELFPSPSSQVSTSL